MNFELELLERECIHCALRNGRTADEARECDTFSVACPDCPFATTIADKAALAEAIANRKETS